MSGPDARPPGLDRELAHLDPAERMRVWANRVQAMLFAAPGPVDRAVLARAIGPGVAVEAVIDALRRALEETGLTVARLGSGWTLRTRPDHAVAVRLALGGGAAPPPEDEMTPRELMVLAAIAHYQPVSRAGLGEVFGQVPGDALLGRLRRRGLIAAGPRGPGRGAAHTFVTTPAFLETFDFADLEAFGEEVPMPGAGAGRLRPGRGA